MASEEHQSAPPKDDPRLRELTRDERAEAPFPPGEAAFDLSPVSQLIIDPAGRVGRANESARQAFGLRQDDLGRSFSRLRLSHQPADLRSAVDRVNIDGIAVRFPDVEFAVAPDDVRLLRIQVAPLLVSGDALGALITFEDVTATPDVELGHVPREREATHQEIQASNEELGTLSEELEASNEELETVNEELRSTNAELEAINAELEERSAAHAHVDTFLDAILTGLGVGVIVLDPELRITVWNARAHEQWGPRSDEVEGLDVADLDINLPIADLLPSLRAVLSGEVDEHQDTIEAFGRTGRPISCRIIMTPLRTGPEPHGVILLMDDVPR